MRAMTAAASARRSNDGPSTWPIGRPTIGALRKKAIAESPPAMTQTNVPTRLVLIPSCAARSVDSAAARTATPNRDRRRKAERATPLATTTSTAITWLPRNTTGDHVKAKLNGVGNCWLARSRPKARGKMSSKADSSWAMPMVATVRMSRGALAKRRTNRNSATPPTIRALVSPTASPTK